MPDPTAALDAIEALHPVSPAEPDVGIMRAGCEACQVAWPCPTVRVIAVARAAAGSRSGNLQARLAALDELDAALASLTGTVEER